MKKILCVLLTLAMVLAAVACAVPAEGNGVAAPASAPAAEAPAESAEAVAAPAGDVNWKEFTLNAKDIPQEKLDTTLYIAVNVRTLDNPYNVTIVDGMDLFAQYLDSIGQKYEKQTMTYEGSNDTCINNLAQFAAKAAGNGLAYCDPNEDVITYTCAEQMANSNCFIGTTWNKTDELGPEDLTPYWVIHTSPDNAEMGYNTAKAMFESFGGEGEIFVVEGQLGNTANSGRVEGLEKALAEYPGVKVVARDATDWEMTKALSKVETWLTQYPDVKGVWCANDDTALGALQALKNAGLNGKVGVTGIDALDEVVREIGEGNITATCAANGPLQGSYTLAICYAAWTGQLDVAALPHEYREFATTMQLVTADNVDDYINNKPAFDFSKPFSCKAD